MNTYKKSNISLADFRDFVAEQGCKKIKGKDGGHEKWWKEGMVRPVVFQTPKDPVPEFIVNNNLKNLGLTTKDFREWLKNRTKKTKS